MLFIKFELILIKIEFFYEFKDQRLKFAQKLVQRPWAIVQGIFSKMARREFSIFIIFSDA